MAGTPYWRERKFVTSSSVRKPSFTRAEPRRQFCSFWALMACSNCSGVMIFSLTRRSPSRCDIRRSPIHVVKNAGRVSRHLHEEPLFAVGEKQCLCVDTNCHSKSITVLVTVVLGLACQMRVARAVLQNPRQMSFL